VLTATRKIRSDSYSQQQPRSLRDEESRGQDFVMPGPGAATHQLHRPERVSTPHASDTESQTSLVAVSRDIFTWIRLLRDPFNLVWNVSRDGASPTASSPSL